MTDDNKRQQPMDSQQRTATRITLVTFALMVIVALYVLFIVPDEAKTPIDNYMMPMIVLSAGYSYDLARKGRHQRGIYVFLGSIAIAAILYPLAADNVGCL
jgi:hypothetical protein